MGASRGGKVPLAASLSGGIRGRGALSREWWMVSGGPLAWQRVRPTFWTAWRVRRLKALTLYMKSFFFPPSFSPSESLILEVFLPHLCLSLCPSLAGGVSLLVFSSYSLSLLLSFAFLSRAPLRKGSRQVFPCRLLAGRVYSLVMDVRDKQAPEAAALFCLPSAVKPRWKLTLKASLACQKWVVVPNKFPPESQPTFTEQI